MAIHNFLRLMDHNYKKGGCLAEGVGVGVVSSRKWDKSLANYFRYAMGCPCLSNIYQKIASLRIVYTITSKVETFKIPYFFSSQIRVIILFITFCYNKY